MPMPENQILVDKCYQTASGEVRLITAITISGDVIFTSWQEGKSVDVYVEGEQLPGTRFARDVAKAVPMPTALRCR